MDNENYTRQFAEKWRVTVPRGRRDLEPRAYETSQRLGIPFVERGDLPLDRIRAATGVSLFYVEEDKYPCIQTLKGRLYYHENTAGIRLKWNKGLDPIVRACNITGGERVLDATFGLGCDSLVLGTSLTTGTITGLESDIVLADIVNRGLAAYKYSTRQLAESAARISVIAADHKNFLAGCGEASYDVVYFDPMFENTVVMSSSMQRLREVGQMGGVDDETLDRAAAVATRCVVVKMRAGVPEDRAVKFTRIVRVGKTVVYGVIELIS